MQERKITFQHDHDATEILLEMASRKKKDKDLDAINAAIFFLYTKYYSQILGYLLKRYDAPTRSIERNVCSDIAQQTFVKLYNRVVTSPEGAFRKETLNARAYLYTIARNKLLNYIRDNKNKPKRLHENHEDFQTISVTNVEKEIDKQAQIDLMLEKLQQLQKGNANDKMHVQILLMFYVEERSLWDIACVLKPVEMNSGDEKRQKRAVNSIKSRLGRARIKLKELIETTMILDSE